MEKTTPWYIVYDRISQGLIEFYNIHNFENITLSESLFNELSKDSEHAIVNRWIERFDNKQIDPMHLFAAINYSDLSVDDRTIRIKSILKVLRAKPIDGKISFRGCVFPKINKLIATRHYENQKEIWDLFNTITSHKKRILNFEDFNLFNKWYGVDFSSFTVFLFWLKSDTYIPLDENTLTFLLTSNIIEKKPESFTAYDKVVSEFAKQNRELNKEKKNSSFVREIVRVANDTIGEGNKEFITFPYVLEFLIRKSSSDKESTNKSNQRIDDNFNNKILIENLISNRLKKQKNGFKIIAIRALENCDQKYLKVLEKNRFYYFEKSVTISDDLILYKPENDIHIFNSNDSSLKINITAIVGKNGTGKSSLLELLFEIINNIAYTKRELLKTTKLKLLEKLHAELYYINNAGDLCCITVNDKVIVVRKYELDEDNQYHVSKEQPVGFGRRELEDLFYTIVVNYSHYALNSEIIGDWITGIFHKNDGYQTPIVLNPMRTKGIIDANSENKLVKSRLIANLLTPIFNENSVGFSNVSDKQNVVRLKFNLNNEKNKDLLEFEKNNGKNQVLQWKQVLKFKQIILRVIYSEFELTNKIEINPKVEDEIDKYLIKKVLKIIFTYNKSSVKEIFGLSINAIDDNSELKFNINEFRRFLVGLKSKSSHVSFKLLQAINFLKYNLWDKINESFDIEIKNGQKVIENALSGKIGKAPIELIPPSIFDTEIILKDKSGQESSFENMSSGEQQLIHSVSSILYHLMNIDSINESEGKVRYRSANIILDEIELYYHPELQRQFVNYLIRMINQIELKNIKGINICMATHSPYILSDIPDSKILFLSLDENGKSIDTNQKIKTFGGNIHDLLKNSFFMENGIIGEFSKLKINNTINFLNYLRINKEIEKIDNEKDPLHIIKSTELEVLKQSIDQFDKNYHEKLIEIIAEPIIQRKLSEMFDEVTSEKLELKIVQKRIDELRKLEEKLLAKN